MWLNQAVHNDYAELPDHCATTNIISYNEGGIIADLGEQGDN